MSGLLLLYCHACNREVRSMEMRCPACRGEFVEELRGVSALRRRRWPYSDGDSDGDTTPFDSSSPPFFRFGGIGAALASPDELNNNNSANNNNNNNNNSNNNNMDDASSDVEEAAGAGAAAPSDPSGSFGIAVMVQDRLQYLLLGRGGGESEERNSDPGSESSEGGNSTASNNNGRPFGLAIFTHGRLQHLLVGFGEAAVPESSNHPLGLALTISGFPSEEGPAVAAARRGRGGGMGGGGGGGLHVLAGADLSEFIRHLSEQESGRHGSAPASKAAVDAMPTVSITHQTLGSGHVQCTICMEDYELGAKARQMPCNHLYHTDCILPWLELHSSCPICRTEMPSSDDTPSSQIETIDSTSATIGSSSSSPVSTSAAIAITGGSETSLPPLPDSESVTRDQDIEFEPRRTPPPPQTETIIDHSGGSSSSGVSFVDSAISRPLPQIDHMLQSQPVSSSASSSTSSRSRRNFLSWPFHHRSHPPRTSSSGHSSVGWRRRSFWERGWKWLPGA